VQADELHGLWERIRAGERRALAKAITLVESARPDHAAAAEALVESLLPATGSAIRVGVSGVPGAGKSTFIEALGLHLIELGHRIAVLAVDPSSALTGGSILGDKTRMAGLAARAEAFIRPSPARGTLGGVARHTRESMLLCEAAGFDVVLVETVGVGQSEHLVSTMVDTFVLLALAGAGDELQGMKRGILELTDVIAINKADGDNRARAERAAVETTSALRLLRAGSAFLPRVTTLSAREGRGVAEVWALIEEHHRFLLEGGRLEARRREQRRAWLFELVRESLDRELWQSPAVRALAPEIERRVTEGALSPTDGARRLLAAFRQD
jgi:LAO/AO transport system kinase